MKRRSSLLLMSLALAGSLAVPVAVATPPDPGVGVRVNLLSPGPHEIGVGESFHVKHGWTLPVGTPGNFSFELEIDGVDQGNGRRFWEPLATDDGSRLRRVWDVFNHRSGLSAGTYELTGRWFGRCDTFDIDPCSNPNEIVELLVLTRTLVVGA